MRADDPRHGTYRGYRAHRTAGQDACTACKRGVALYENLRQIDHSRGIRRLIDSLGTTRRIEALMAIGWTSGHIADLIGVTRSGVRRIKYSRTVQIGTARRVEAAYDALSGRPGPSEMTRGRARSLGYAPPLAWDDIDNPDETPQGVRRKAAS